MDYMQEINAFYDWLAINPQVSDSARNYALMHPANRVESATAFTVAVSVLEAKTGMSRAAIYRARNVLKQAGRITFAARGGNQCAVYTLVPLASQFETKAGTHAGIQTATRAGTQTETIIPPSPSYPSGTQKTKTVVTVGNPSAALYDPANAEVVRAYEAEIGMISPTVSQTLDGWCEDFEASMLVAVIQDAALSGKRNAKYIDAILRSKQRQGITTLAGYQEAERAFQDNKQRVDMPVCTRNREVYR